MQVKYSYSTNIISRLKTTRGEKMGRRKVPLRTGCFYHVFNKSIAEYEIFRFEEEYIRIRESIRFYKTALCGQSYSVALKNNKLQDAALHGPERVRLIAYCVMPTHIHLLLCQLDNDGIEELMRHAQAGYAGYFNSKTKRKGPLWEGRFDARLIETDEDLLHMTRYIHLNPTSAGLVTDPAEWGMSSYREYLGIEGGASLCDFKGLVSLPPEQYKKFSLDRQDYQRSLQVIKAHLMD
jgi:putative transposase